MNSENILSGASLSSASKNETLLIGDARWTFLLLCAVQLLITYAMQSMVLTDDVIASTLGSEISSNGIDRIMEQRGKWTWLGYAIVPITILIRVFFVACCLYTGFLFSEKFAKQSFSFGKFFSITTSAYFVFIIKAALILFTAVYLVDIQTVEDLRKVDFYSFAALLPDQYYDLWWATPLRVIDAFELIFLFVLAYGTARLLKSPFEASFPLVAISYGAGLFLWILSLLFVNLSFA